MLKTKAGFSAHVLLPLIAILAVLGMGGYVAKHSYDVGQERKQFMAAKTEVNKLGDAIAAETKPTKHQAVQFCDYGHAKLEGAGRTCHTNYYFYYDAIKRAESKDVFKKSAPVIMNLTRNYRLLNNGTNSFSSSLLADGFKLSKSVIECSRSMYLSEMGGEYNRQTIPGLPFSVRRSSSIMILSCSGEAKAEYFPVRKS